MPDDVEQKNANLDCWMGLAAAIFNSGYKDHDSEFIHGAYKWWHDELEEAVMEYNKYKARTNKML